MSSLQQYKRRSLLAVGLLCIGMAQCAMAATQEDPFKMPRAQLVVAVKSIGVMPLAVADAVPNARAVAARYEDAVVRRLTSGGFQVVPPATMQEIRDRYQQSSGGLYNPMDGKPIAARIAQYEQDTRQAYAASHPVDALLSISIDVHGAETSTNLAKWDGIKENITGKGGMASFFTGGGVNGTMPALSFVAVLRDHTGQVLYTKSGGLQLLHYVYVGYFGTSQRDVDPQDILSDPGRDQRAIEIALGPLAGSESPEAVGKVEIAPVASAAHPADVPTVSREALVAQYPRLLLVPLQMADIPQRAAVQQRLASALESKLTALGFSIVRADQYDAVWKAERERVGGFYDPMTGKLNAAKARDSRVAMLASLGQGQPAQGIVYPSVTVRVAQFAQGDAHWDGVRERAFIAKSALGGIFNVARTLIGQLDAASLHIRIASNDDATLFDDYGGLQLIEKIDHGALSAVPAADLFADPARDTVAVDIALQGLSGPPKGK
jgi:hypothetical protein